jgi:hypothetical protein
LNSNSNKIFENAYRVENGVGNIRRWKQSIEKNMPSGMILIIE